MRRHGVLVDPQSTRPAEGRKMFANDVSLARGAPPTLVSCVSYLRACGKEDLTLNAAASCGCAQDVLEA